MTKLARCCCISLCISQCCCLSWGHILVMITIKGEIYVFHPCLLTVQIMKNIILVTLGMFIFLGFGNIFMHCYFLAVGTDPRQRAR